jgi:HTH-type transcriptional regulator / antitoxin HigA
MTVTPPTFAPDWLSPPGDTLQEMLDERSMTQTELADRLGVTVKHVNRVVKGAASLAPEMALGLEKVLGASAGFWMTREAHYQADKARIAQREKFADATGWAKKFPLAEMRKRRRLAAGLDGAELVESVVAFLGIAAPDQWRQPQVAYRKSQKFDSDEYALSAWLREGEIAAAEIECEPYDEERFLEALQAARSLTCEEDPDVWFPALQERCAAAGVAVVVVEAYKNVKANGATRWLSPDKALIQLSLRHAWIDIFWFSFFHEAGHVVLHRKKEIFVEVPPKDRSEDPQLQQLEREADRFASRTLIPSTFDRRLKSLALSEVPAFAKTIGVSPAIVVGRMMHDKLLPWNSREGNRYRARLKHA